MNAPHIFLLLLNIHSERSLSQNLDLGLSYYFMLCRKTI